MTLHVLFFAMLARKLGTERLSLQVGDGSTVGNVLDLLSSRYPDVNAMRGTLAFAVNMNYVKLDHVLADGDELALIPPVSGG